MSINSPTPASERDKCLQFFKEHPTYFWNQLSKHHPLTEEQLSRFGDRLNWNLVSYNKAIIWTESLMTRFRNELNWGELSVNPTAFKDIRLLELFENDIDWLGDEHSSSDSIANNEGLPWCLDFLKRYESRIDFYKLSSNRAFPWSEEIIEAYHEKLSFNELCFNEGVPWNLKMFDKYLTEYKTYAFYINSRMRQDIEIIEKYSEHIEWSFICGEPNLPWKEKNLLERWKEHIDGWGIAQNEALFDEVNVFFNEHLDKWTDDDYRLFEPLSSNRALPWSIPFIEAYKGHWDWARLSRNESLPWSTELIEHFRDNWVWGCYYDTSQVDEKGFEISPTGGKARQDGLVINEALPWSIDFINLYSKSIDFELLGKNEAVWDKAFKPYLANVLIAEIFDSQCHIASAARWDRHTL